MRMKSKHVVFAVLAALAVTIILPHDAKAHHGWRSYDADLDLQVEVTEVKLGNPHDRLAVKDSEGDTWDILLAPPVRNRRYGFDGSVIKVGDSVRLLGERHPDRKEAKIHQIWNGGEMIYEYLYNGRQTSYERLGKLPPEIASEAD